MHYRKNNLTFSPTDLSRWLNSPYASWMARDTIEAPDAVPPKDEPHAMLTRLATRGLDHEDALEQEFRDQGLTVITSRQLSGNSE